MIEIVGHDLGDAALSETIAVCMLCRTNMGTRFASKRSDSVFVLETHPVITLAA